MSKRCWAGIILGARQTGQSLITIGGTNTEAYPGRGSMQSLPTVEAQEGDVSAYIPINVGISVSRIGSASHSHN